MERVVGQTQDVGFQIGVSRTLDHPPEAVWNFLTGSDGLAVWLGEGAELGAEKGETYRALDGTEGEIRSFRPVDRLRLTWRPPGWDHDTTCRWR